MKKAVSVFLSIVMIITSMSVMLTTPTTAASIPTVSNLLNNSNFNTPTGFTADSILNRIPGFNATNSSALNQWFRYTQGNATVYDAIVDDGSGSNNCARVAQTLCQGVSLKPSRTYEISFRIKTDYLITFLSLSFMQYTPGAPATLGSTDLGTVMSSTEIASTLPSGVTFAVGTTGAVANTQTTTAAQIKNIPVDMSTWTTYKVRVTTRSDMPASSNYVLRMISTSYVGASTTYYIDDYSMAELDPYATNLFANGDFNGDNSSNSSTSMVAAINAASYEGDTMTSTWNGAPAVTGVTYANSHLWYRATGGGFTAGTSNSYSGTAYETGNSGNKIVKVGQTLKQVVNAPLNKTYRLSFRVKEKALVNNTTYTVAFGKVNAANTAMDVINIVNTNGYRSYLSGGNTVTEVLPVTTASATAFTISLNDAKLVDNWVTYTYTFSLSSANTYTTEFTQVWFNTTSYSGTYGDPTNRFVYMDDVSMTDVTETSTSFMENSNFSSGFDNWVLSSPTAQSANILSDANGKYVRLANTGSGTLGSIYTDKTMHLTAGKSYKLSLKVRRPSEVTYVAAQAPIFQFYVPGQDTQIPPATPPAYSATYFEGKNDYAYSYASGTTLTRHMSFTSQYSVTTPAGATASAAINGYSGFGKDVLTNVSSLGLTAATLYADWTTIDYTFTLPADAATYDADVRFAIRVRNALESFEFRDISFGEAAVVTASVDTSTGTKGGRITAGASTATVIGGTATVSAAPFDGYTFDGWYLNSTKVSSNPTETFTVAAASNYVAKFINNKSNLVYDSGFENYGGNTTSLYYSPNGAYSKYSGLGNWEAVSSSDLVVMPVPRPDTWGTVTVTSGGVTTGNNQVSPAPHSGNYSLRLFARYQDCMTTITGLEANTNYVASVWYNLDPIAANVVTKNPTLDSSTPALTPSSFVQRFGVMSASNDRVNTISSANNNVIATKVVNDSTHTSQWVQGKVYFNSGSETSVKFFICHSSNIGVETPALYVDDLTVTKVSADVKHIGTAVRTTGNQGLRFKTQVDKSMTATDATALKGSKVVEYGTLAIKADYLGAAELKLDGAYVVGGTERMVVGVAYKQGVKDIRFSESDTTVQYTAVLTNIAPANYTKQYVIRPYMVMEDSAGVKTTVYGQQQSASIFDIAALAYNAKDSGGQYIEAPLTRQFLFDNILHVADSATYGTFLN